MKKLLMMIATLLILIAMTSGCASKIPTNIALEPSENYLVKGEIKGNRSDFKNKLKSDIMNNVFTSQEDKVANTYISNYIDNYINRVINSNFCKYKIELLQQRMDENSITNDIFSATKIPAKIKSSGVNVDIQHTDSEGVSINTYIADFSKAYVYGMKLLVYQDYVKEGYTKVDLVVKYTCSDNDSLNYTASIASYDVLNPYAAGMQVSELEVDTHYFASAVKQMAGISADFKIPYTYISSDIKMILKKRYLKSETSTMKFEKIYAIPHDVAISRMQRKLEHFKYDQDKSLFIFKDILYIPCTNKDNVSYGEKYENYSCSFPLEFSIALFPEANGKTSAVFSFSYPVLIDSFNDKAIYTEREANKYFQQLIFNIDNVMK